MEARNMSGSAASAGMVEWAIGTATAITVVMHGAVAAAMSNKSKSALTSLKEQSLSIPRLGCISESFDVRHHLSVPFALSWLFPSTLHLSCMPMFWHVEGPLYCWNSSAGAGFFSLLDTRYVTIQTFF